MNRAMRRKLDIKERGEKSNASLNIEIKEVGDNKEFFEIEFIGSTPDVDHADDIVLPEAIQKSIETYGMPKFLNGHKQREFPLGTITEYNLIGTASVFKAKIPKIENDPFTNRLIALLKMKAFGGTSIGFFTLDREFKDGVRIIKEIELIEISLVSIPCNAFAEVLGVKARELSTDDKKLLKLEEAFKSIMSDEDPNEKDLEFESLKDIEKFLKSLGLSNKKSTTILSKAFELKKLSDSEDEAKRVEEEQKALSDSVAKKEREAQEEILKSLDDILKPNKEK